MIKQINNNLDDRIASAVLDTAISICATLSDGLIVRTNSRFNELLGYDNTELLETNFFDLLPIEYQKNEKKLDQQFWVKQQGYSSVFKMRCKDGSYRVFEASFTFVEDISSPLKVATFKDVTELWRLNELMNRVGEQTKVGGWERDLATDDIIWTKGIFSIYELPVGDIPRFGDEELHAFFPDGGLNDIIDSHEYTYRTGEKSEVVTKFISAKGTHKWVRNVTEALIVNGKIVKLFGTFHDITEDKERELLLEESKVRYKYLFDNNPNALLLIDRDGDCTIRDANRATELLYGYSKKELVGMSAKVLRQANDSNELVSNNGLESSSAIENIEVSVSRHIKKDGTLIDVEEHWNDITLDGKEIRLSLINNISEKVQRTNELQRTNAFLSTLIESAPIGVVMIDKQANVEIWNAHAEKIFGWSSEDVIGKTLPFVPTHKNDEFQQNLKEAFSRQENFMLELERVDVYGETIYLREFVTPIKVDNEVVDKVLLLIEDITDTTLVQKALVDSEMKYRSLVEASNDLILKTNLRGMITFTNQAANNVLGFSPFDMIGKNALRFVHETAKRDWYNIYQALRRGEHFKNVDLHLENAKGEKVSVNATFQSTLNEEGEVVGFTCYAADISDRIKYQSHLETMLKEKEILIKEIHHRVKNNLAVVSGLLSLQSTALKSETAKRAFAESQARIKSIATIHEKLYQNELFSSVEIKNYLEQLVKDISTTYRNPNKDITTRVVGDAVELNVNQAVPFGIMANELLINAHKYAFEDRIFGEIEVNIKKDDEGQVTVSVEDNGVGLPENFDSNEDGSSLGMILIKSLSMQLEAQLQVSSDKGTRFAITFTPEE